MLFFKNFSDLRLRTKLLLAYLGLITVLFVSGGAGALMLMERAVKADVKAHLRSDTRAIINLVETTAQGAITNYLRAVAERNLEIARMVHAQSVAGELTDAQARQQIRDLFLSQTIGQTGYIYCMNSIGIATVHPNPKVEGFSWRHYEFVRRQIERKTGYMEYRWKNPEEPGDRPKAMYMTYFAPYDWIISVTSYRDEFSDLLPMDEIRRSIGDMTIGESGYAFILDRQGNILVHQVLADKNLHELESENAQFFQTMLSRKEGATTYWWQNPDEPAPREKLVYFGHIQGLDWVVGSAGYLEEIYAPISQVRKSAIGFTLMALLLSTLLTLWISNSITRRLNHLMTVIGQGERGDLTVRSLPGPADEVGRLGRAFNAFLERLQTYHHQLTAEVSEHRTTSDSLRKAHDFNTLILDTVEALVIVLDQSGRIVSFNRACQERSGYSAKEVHGADLLDTLVPPGEKEAVQTFFAGLDQPHKKDNHTHHWISKSGQQRLIQWSSVVIPAMDERGDLIVSGGLDITDLRATKSALKESEALFEAVFNQSYQFISVLAPDGKIRSINQTALAFGDQRTGALVGMNFWDTPYWQHASRVRTRLKTAILNAARGQTERMQLPHLRGDGEERHVDISIKPVCNDDGEVFMLIAEGRDITEQKRMEAQLLQSQKMDAIGTLAGGIAHDFNNNLQAISGYVQLLQLDEYGNDKQKEMLATIQHACTHASELTRQLLTFSRKIESQLAPIDINAELAGVVKLLQRTLPRMIQVETRLAEELHICHADRVQLEQIVMNMGINAGHAMPEGGRLAIETSNADLDDAFCRTHAGAVAGSYVRLAISDTGHGMDAETRAHIFEPFFTQRADGGGTGLGLAMVYGIVKSHKGYIQCHSQPGDGTTFDIYLPAVWGGGISVQPSPETPRLKGGHESILIIDDNRAVRRLGREVLTRFGYQVRTAADGASGVELFHQLGGNVDLILLDLDMPTMGGGQCLEAIRQTGADMPVLVTSGYVPDGQTKMILDELADGFFGKPYDVEELIRVVRETLDRAAGREL